VSGEQSKKREEVVFPIGNAVYFDTNAWNRLLDHPGSERICAQLQQANVAVLASIFSVVEVANTRDLERRRAPLLGAAAQSGELFVTGTDQDDKWVKAGVRDFRDENDPAFAARHLDALEWLVNGGFARHDTGSRFTLTGKGFETARALRS
jgi:hypothetical protein